MMSAELATTGLLKIIFCNKCFHVTIFIDDFTNKLSSRGSNYTVDLVMRPKVSSF